MVGWRVKIGLLLLAVGPTLWLLVPLAFILGIEPERIFGLTGGIVIFNKVLLLACLAILGRSGFNELKTLVRGRLIAGNVGPTRHAIGLVMFCLPLMTAILEPYVDKFFPGLRPNLWQAQVVGDAMLIASFFVLGIDFWQKFAALFVRTAKVVDVPDRHAPAS